MERINKNYFLQIPLTIFTVRMSNLALDAAIHISILSELYFN